MNLHEHSYEFFKFQKLIRFKSRQIHLKSSQIVSSKIEIHQEANSSNPNIQDPGS
jgi:hypothetical protein